MALCDFSNNLETHAYVIGILMILGCIGSLGWTSYDTSVGVSAFLACLAFLCLYWYGFLKRNPLCMLICIVLAVFGVIGAGAILFGTIVAIFAVGWPAVIDVVFALFFTAFQMYLWQVMAQLHQSFLSDSNAGKV